MTRRSVLIAPSILSADFARLAEEVARVEAEVDAELDRVQAEALAAPFPASVSIPEFNDG